MHLSSGDVVEGTVLRTTTDSLYVRPASRFATPTMAFAATQLVSIDTHAFSPRRTAGYVALLSVGTFAVVAAAMNVAQASGGRTY
ncbi:MAG: hypothetical protein ABJE47_13580 [bacterium]